MSTQSALHALDLLERHYVHEGVSSPVHENTVMQWVGTSLSIAGVPLLIGEGELDEIIETPRFTAIPGTKPWVLGVASHRGGMLPIINGDVLFRKVAYTGRDREYCMVIKRPGMHLGITLSDIERNIKFPVEAREMDRPIDPDFAAFCLGGFQHGDKFLAVLDMDKLAADAELSNASASDQDITEERSNDKKH